MEIDRKKLGKLAREKVLLLAEVERDVFHFDVRDGKLVLKNPKYWDVSGDAVQVFLRFE